MKNGRALIVALIVENMVGLMQVLKNGYRGSVDIHLRI